MFKILYLGQKVDSALQGLTHILPITMIVMMRSSREVCAHRFHSTIIRVRARLVDYLFPMSRPTLFLGPTLKKKKFFFFTFRPTLSRGAFFSSENCILNEINKKKSE